MATHVALTTFADVNLPERILGMGWNQIHLALGFQSAVMMIFWIFVSKSYDAGFGLTVSFDFGIGFWLMLLSGIALAVGAVLRQQEAPTTAL